jgi:hypothetical protein
MSQADLDNKRQFVKELIAELEKDKGFFSPTPEADIDETTTTTKPTKTEPTKTGSPKSEFYTDVTTEEITKQNEEEGEYIDDLNRKKTIATDLPVNKANKYDPYN